MRRAIVWTIAAALIGAATANGQTSEGQSGGSSSSSPFFGSASQGTASATPISLSVKDAVDRALQFNLGLLLQEEEVKRAHGARWRALAALLPDISTGITTSRQIINLEAYGFQANPSVIGPFNVFDARVYASQPVLDLRALNDARAASANERAETLGVRTARDLVTLVAVNLYLEAVAAASRVEATQAQQATAEALSTQAADMKQAGVVAGIDL
ncbi:MAG: TolC family protein, partial [Acidobacteria bacterium]|nr:TolC family protein [Acidobacteriota bacterium]